MNYNKSKVCCQGQTVWDILHRVPIFREIPQVSCVVKDCMDGHGCLTPSSSIIARPSQPVVPDHFLTGTQPGVSGLHDTAATIKYFFIKSCNIVQVILIYSNLQKLKILRKTLKLAVSFGKTNLVVLRIATGNQNVSQRVLFNS